MKALYVIMLIGLAAGTTGCNSHDANQSNQVRHGEREVKDPVDLDRGHSVAAPPACIDGTVDRAANQAQTAIDAAAIRTQQVTSDVNRAVDHAQAEAQQVTNDAARLGNDATRAVNSAARDIDRLKNAFR
jgi:hypothetical protein